MSAIAAIRKAREVFDLPVDPSPAEVKKLLRRGHSYIATVDLSPSSAGNAPGQLRPYGGYGLYLSHQSEPDTVLQCTFDQNFKQPVVFRRGVLHCPGPGISPARSPYHFSQFYAQVTQGGAKGTGLAIGTAYFVVLGTPESLYFEDPRAIAYRPAEVDTTLVGAAGLVNVIGPYQIQTLANVRITLAVGVAALNSAPIQISPDGTNWETILGGTFDALGIGAVLSAGIPQGARYVRVQAKSAGNATVKAWITGTMA